MTKCTDIRIGQMLHAYELNLLANADLELFEQHLLGCTECAENLRKSQLLTSALRDDPEIKSMARDFAEVNEKRRSRWKDILWPQVPFVLRPAILTVLLLILVYPAYRGIMTHEEIPNTVRPIERQLVLIQNRSESGEPKLEFDKLTSLIVSFPGIERTKTYRLSLHRSSDSSEIYSNMQTRFDESGVATILIEPGSLDAGRYFVRLRNPDGSGDWKDLEFVSVRN